MVLTNAVSLRPNRNLMIKKIGEICWRFVVSSKVMIDVPRQGFARYFRFGRLAEVDHVRAQTGR